MYSSLLLLSKYYGEPTAMLLHFLSYKTFCLFLELFASFVNHLFFVFFWFSNLARITYSLSVRNLFFQLSSRSNLSDTVRSLFFSWELVFLLFVSVSNFHVRVFSPNVETFGCQSVSKSKVLWC